MSDDHLEDSPNPTQKLTFGALERLRISLRNIAKHNELPSTSRMARVVGYLGAQDQPVSAPKPAMLDQVRSSLISAARSNGIASLASRELREAPWLLWTENEPLANLQGLLPTLHRVAERSPSMRRNLIEAWIAGCLPGAPRIEESGRWISQFVLRTDDARLEQWRTAERIFRFFDSERGPEAVAKAIVDGSDPVERILETACLNTPLRAVGGYVRTVQTKALEIIPSVLPSQKGLSAFTRTSGFIVHEGKLRFDEPVARGKLADAFLQPSQGLKGGTPEALRKLVQSFLLQEIGDPRTRLAKWKEAKPESVNVMRRWLSTASLKAFFDVIADHADHNFKYRRAFWSAYLDHGVIEDAWLALGSNVYAAAGAIRELNGAYARLGGGGANQSILLMRVGPLIFCEWSHVGKVRAWPQEAVSAPRLYQPGYARADVMQKSMQFPENPRYGSKGALEGAGLAHFTPQSGYWQGSVAELIAQKTKIRLESKDWMPR